MLYMNLSTKELYTSMTTKMVEKLMKLGLEAKNERLTISAMEEILCRGDSDLVVKILNQAFKDKVFEQEDLISENLLLFMIARSLFDSTRELDPMLYLYSKAVIREGIFMSPTEWIKQEAPNFQKVHRSGAVMKAHPWAYEYLMTDEERANLGRLADELRHEEEAKERRNKLATESLAKFFDQATSAELNS
jgi:hypothetical protein